MTKSEHPSGCRISSSNTSASLIPLLLVEESALARNALVTRLPKVPTYLDVVGKGRYLSVGTLILTRQFVVRDYGGSIDSTSLLLKSVPF